MLPAEALSLGFWCEFEKGSYDKLCHKLLSGMRSFQCGPDEQSVAFLHFLKLAIQLNISCSMHVYWEKGMHHAMMV